MGLKADRAKNIYDAQNLIKLSLILFEKAQAYQTQDKIMQENFQLDHAASFYSAGKFFLESDKTAAEKYFLEAEKIWLPLLKDRNMKKKRDLLVYYRTCWHLTKLYREWGKEELYKKYLNILPAELQKGL